MSIVTLVTSINDVDVRVWLTVMTDDCKTCPIFPPPNPVAVPLLTIVAPAGTVKVSPESPNAKATPVAGEILLVLTSVVDVIVVGKSNVESVKYQFLKLFLI